MRLNHKSESFDTFQRLLITTQSCPVFHHASVLTWYFNNSSVESLPSPHKLSSSSSGSTLSDYHVWISRYRPARWSRSDIFHVSNSRPFFNWFIWLFCKNENKTCLFHNETSCSNRNIEIKSCSTSALSTWEPRVPFTFDAFRRAEISTCLQSQSKHSASSFGPTVQEFLMQNRPTGLLLCA